MSERQWIVGYPPGGITGPTTPATGGSTCDERVEWADWQSEFDAALKAGAPYGVLPPSPKPRTVLVTCGMDTIAIVPFPECGGKEGAEANARLIASAPALLAALEYLLQDMDAEPDDYPRWKDKIRSALKAAGGSK